MNHLISVIVPTCNTPGRLLNECIRSVFAQSYDNWELILINDGSRDVNSSELVSTVDSYCDSRLKIIHLDTNIGYGPARNIGMESACGEIITFLDADDMYLPWHLSELHKVFMQEQDCSIVHTHNVICLQLPLQVKLFAFTGYYSRLPQGGLPTLEDIAGEPICPRLALRRSVAQSVRYQPLINCDREMILQIASDSDLYRRAVYMNNSGYLYRDHRSRKRLRYRLKEIMAERVDCIERYAGRGGCIDLVLACWLTCDRYFKHCFYLTGTSTWGCFKRIVKSALAPVEKINCLITLFILKVNQVLTALFGCDLNHIICLLKMLTGLRCNVCLERLFQSHLKIDRHKNVFAGEMYDFCFNRSCVFGIQES